MTVQVTAGVLPRLPARPSETWPEGAPRLPWKWTCRQEDATPSQGSVCERPVSDPSLLYRTVPAATPCVVVLTCMLSSITG